MSKHRMTYNKPKNNPKNDPLKGVNDMRAFQRILLYIIEYDIIKNQPNNYVIRYTLKNIVYDTINSTIRAYFDKFTQFNIYLTCQTFMTKCQ